MTQHTNGPWVANCPSFKGWQIQKQGDTLKPLAVVYSRDEDYGIDGGRYSDQECKANARLMAATPVLLAACVAMRVFIESWANDYYTVDEDAQIELRRLLDIVNLAIEKSKE